MAASACSRRCWDVAVAVRPGVRPPPAVPTKGVRRRDEQQRSSVPRGPGLAAASRGFPHFVAGPAKLTAPQPQSSVAVLTSRNASSACVSSPVPAPIPRRCRGIRLMRRILFTLTSLSCWVVSYLSLILIYPAQDQQGRFFIMHDHLISASDAQSLRIVSVIVTLIAGICAYKTLQRSWRASKL